MRRWTLALLAALVVAGSLRAQQPMFKTGVDYVNVDCIVTDGDDRPITDLTRSDFEIVERGNPQTITDFKYVSIPVAHRTIDVTQPAAPESDIATNTPPKPNSRLFVMVVDDLHLLEQDIVPVQRTMTDFLRALSPDDEVAIVFVGRSDLSQDFTTDVGRLMLTVSHVKGAFGFGLDPVQQLSGASQARLNGAAPDDPTGGNQPRGLSFARSTGWELRNVAAALAGSGHSRRAIVLVSGGVSINPNASTKLNSPERTAADTIYQELQDAFAAARRSDVPIYTLDPRGGVTPDSAVRGLPPQMHPNDVWPLIHVQQSYLATIAVNTGGRAIFNRNDLTGAVNDIVAENGSFYLLGYYPEPFVRDGAFHEISVKVKRPGAHVRARAGYLTPQPASKLTATNAKTVLDSALSAGLNATGIQLRAFAAPISATTKGMATVVTVEVDYPTPPDGPRNIDDDLQMEVVALDPDASIKATSMHTFHFAAAAPSTTSAQFVIDDVIDLPSRPLTLRIGVSCRALGKAGTAQVFVDVPHPSADQLQLSNVVLGLTSGNREPALQADALKGLIPFQPTTARTFETADTLRIYARAFWGSSASGVTATVTIDAGPATQSVQIEEIPATPNGPRHQSALTATLSLKNLAAGPHTLTLETKLPNGQSAKRVVPFEVR